MSRRNEKESKFHGLFAIRAKTAEFADPYEAGLERSRPLTRDQKRILDYFWNRKTATHRPRLPQSVLWFLETDCFSKDDPDVIQARADLLTLQLHIKQYIERSSDQTGVYFELTPKGETYLRFSHPRIVNYLQRMIELSPPLLTLTITIVGFIASIVGIIQFVDWVRHLHPHS